MDGQGKRVKHFSTEAIQDNEGGGTSECPQSPAMDDDVMIRSKEQDLTNRVMEENFALHRQLRESNQERLEALSANKKWLEYSRRLETELERWREENEELKVEMLTERECRAAEKLSMPSAGAGFDTLERRNQWLEDENQQIQQQLSYTQSRLRKYEIEENMPPGPPEWQCKRCTLLNLGACGKCEACGMQAPKRFLGYGKLEADGHGSEE